MVVGYGATHVPLGPGSHVTRIPMFVPEFSSIMQRVTGYLMGKKPEFVDPRVVASGEGRDVTRVCSEGSIKVEFHVITKDLKRLGYETNPRGPAEEIQNQGPSEGIGLVQKTTTESGKGVGRKREKGFEAEPEGDPEAIQTISRSTIEEGYEEGSQVQEC